MIAVVLVSASRNGFANSQLAAIPLNTSSGGCWPLLRLMATRSDCPPITICRTSISRGVATWFPAAGSSVKDVSPRSRGKDGMAFAPWRGRRRHLFARPRLKPVAPVEPPASLPLLGRGHECVRTGWIDRPDHEGRLRIGRRVDKALEMAAV